MRRRLEDGDENQMEAGNEESIFWCRCNTGPSCYVDFFDEDARAELNEKKTHLCLAGEQEGIACTKMVH